MTEINLNAKDESASRELNGLQDFSPCPPSTVAYRVRWYRGAPVIPMGMDAWEFFGFKCEDDFLDAQDRENDFIDACIEEAAANAAAEDAQAASLSILENHRPTSQNERLTLKNVALCNKSKKLRVEAEEDIRKRYRLVEYVKDVLKSCLNAKSAVLNCCKTPVGSFVRIFHSSENGVNSSRVDRLVHDHNVWVCAICSLKVAIGRVLQLYQLGENARAAGYSCYFLTITMGHHVWERLSPMMEDMKLARKYFWENGSVKRIFKANFVGRVSSLEIMRGFGDMSNGWHPHQHIMLIGDRNIDIKGIEKVFSDAWIHALERVGREGKEGVALQLKPCERTEDSFDYLLKYVFEVTLGNVTKHGHGEHMSFFQMVEFSRTIPMLRDEIEPLIKEYYFATKGKRQLVFSDGLLKRFDVQDKTDNELAEEDESKVVRLLAIVRARDWRRLSHAETAEVRILAGRDDKEGVKSYFPESWDSEKDVIASNLGGELIEQKTETRGKHEKTCKAG